MVNVGVGLGLVLVKDSGREASKILALDKHSSFYPPVHQRPVVSISGTFLHKLLLVLDV